MTDIDPVAFRDFEFEGWQKVANRYHDTFAGVTVQSLFDIMMNASVRNAALLHAQRPDVLKAIEMEMRTAVETYRTDSGFELPMPAVLTSASLRPAR